MQQPNKVNLTIYDNQIRIDSQYIQSITSSLQIDFNPKSQSQQIYKNHPSTNPMADNYRSQDTFDHQLDQDHLQHGFSDDSPLSHQYSNSNHDEEDDHESMDEQEKEEDYLPEQSESEHKQYQIIQEQVKDLPNVTRVTSPFMTKFQKAKIIGVRSVQISKNAPLYLENKNIANMNWDPITIAKKELAEKRIPFIIRRYLPDGSFEDWKLSELKTFD